ncbi:hypothetical protein AA303_08045 [Pseudomonas psychrophila]|uniref:hypothetical protein n=1 Tax=Pseudomonas psychrophila TaxID=122355 RepID=UPI00062A0DB9|nr:hypothetical protein [Pseudomonas psychrophila]KOX65616.1 hypothetical protein AA303_08045 [Pseudomonas psychrophila]
MTELSDRQRAAIDMLETAAQTAHDIVHLPADVIVETGSGPSPTFLALAKMITDLTGGLLLPRKQAIPAAGVALALDVAYTNGVSFFDVTLDKPQCLLTFLNTDVPAGYTWSFTVRLRQGTGANKVTFPASVHWSSKRPPVLAYEAGTADLLTFISDDNGWLGISDGSWFDVSVPA